MKPIESGFDDPTLPQFPAEVGGVHPSEKWFWMVRWCKRHGLPPADAEVWRQAAVAWEKRDDRPDWCETMQRPRQACQCPDCGPALVDLAPEDPATAAEVARLRDALATARASLRWYQERVSDCRKMTRQGDAARQALDADGGQRAAGALGETAPAVAPFARLHAALAQAAAAMRTVRIDRVRRDPDGEEWALQTLEWAQWLLTQAAAAQTVVDETEGGAA